MIWHDGEILPDDALRVGIADRVFEHGLGLFETFRIVGRAGALARAAPGAARGLRRERSESRSRASRCPIEMRSKSCSNAAGTGGDALLRLDRHGRLRVGDPGRLDRGPAAPAARDDAAPGRHEGRVSPNRSSTGTRCSTTGAGAGRSRWAAEQGDDEVLLVSPEGHVWEGSRNNLLVVTSGRSGVVETPGLQGPVLPGIMRRVALDFAGERGYAIEERIVNLRELLRRRGRLPDELRPRRPAGRSDRRPADPDGRATS